MWRAVHILGVANLLALVCCARPQSYIHTEQRDTTENEEAIPEFRGDLDHI